MLAQEIRDLIVSTVAKNGGHLASNLGVVELSIVLHRIFNSPHDKIVWDVGHQCYTHKILTGRYKNFTSLRQAGGIAGFPKSSESPHDVFNTGHASTSISAALGMLAGQSEKSYVIAVIGDGALTGGLAYEALSHAGHLGLPLIVILNDNNMSISPNVGGLSKYLSRLSMKAKYQIFRRNFDALVKKIPFFGEVFFEIVLRLKRAVKAVFYIDNFFVDLGFEYVGPIGGHNIRLLENVLADVRNLNRPVVVHVITQKGKGYSYAEEDPGGYHGVGSFSVDGGLGSPVSKNKTFTESFSETLLSCGHIDDRVTVITAAMEQSTGLTPFRKNFPNRFFDVGIAEGHAVTFAAGLASSGKLPVAAVYSTFIQRAVDQIIHDTALQKLQIILALDRAGFVSSDGETHQGLFDIALFRGVPNCTILAPASARETELMLNYALFQKQQGPVVIRYPKAHCPDEIEAFNLPLQKGRGVFVKQAVFEKSVGFEKYTGFEESAGFEKSIGFGKSAVTRNVCIAFTGGLYPEALDAAAILEQKNIDCDLYNLRFLKPVDEAYLVELINSYKIFVIAEEGIREGGFGEYAASVGRKSDILLFAAESNFCENALGSREELLALNGLNGRNIAEKILMKC